MKYNRNEVSRRLKALRISKNMTIEEWAEVFGLNNSSISRWENGSIPHQRTLKKIAEYSGVTTEYILFGSFEEYVQCFFQQFPNTYRFLSKFESFFSDVAEYMKTNYYSYGDEELLISYLLENYPVIIPQFKNELKDYATLNNLSLKDMNYVQIEDDPNFRFVILEKIDTILSSGKDLNSAENFESILNTLIYFKQNKDKEISEYQEQLLLNNLHNILDNFKK